MVEFFANMLEYATEVVVCVCTLLSVWLTQVFRKYIKPQIQSTFKFLVEQTFGLCRSWVEYLVRKFSPKTEQNTSSKPEVATNAALTDQELDEMFPSYDIKRDRWLFG